MSWKLPSLWYFSRTDWYTVNKQMRFSAFYSCSGYFYYYFSRLSSIFLRFFCFVPFVPFTVPAITGANSNTHALHFHLCILFPWFRSAIGSTIFFSTLHWAARHTEVVKFRCPSTGWTTTAHSNRVGFRHGRSTFFLHTSHRSEKYRRCIFFSPTLFSGIRCFVFLPSEKSLVFKCDQTSLFLPGPATQLALSLSLLSARVKIVNSINYAPLVFQRYGPGTATAQCRVRCT